MNVYQYPFFLNPEISNHHIGLALITVVIYCCYLFLVAKLSVYFFDEPDLPAITIGVLIPLLIIGVGLL